MQHREDVFVASDVTDSILDPSALQPGQPGSFSPPVKTEGEYFLFVIHTAFYAQLHDNFSSSNVYVGGFVPRDPTLDGPYFESNFNSVYHHQTTDNVDSASLEHAPLPSITEPPKIVENGEYFLKHFL